MIPEHVYTHALATFFAPIAPYLADHTVSEVMINGPDCVYIERAGSLTRTEARFANEAALLGALRVLAQYVDRPFDREHPVLEARMPDGSRVEAVAAPIAKGGVHIAIRRFSRDKLCVEALIANKALTPQAAQWLSALVESKHNVIVSGGTGTGKTSLLNVLSGFIPDGERTVVLEDARELSPRGEHTVQLEARPNDERGRGAITIRDLFKATLRLRPDRIVVGEIRDGAAMDLLQAMNSGHGGCLSTLHASHPLDALARLETMALMADIELPLRALRAQIASAVDVVVQLDRLRDGARVVTHIAEVIGLDEREQYQVRELFVRRGQRADHAGELVFGGVSTAMRERVVRRARGLPPELLPAFEEREASR
jgi:pilus assembly protein CpaF